MNFFGFIKNKEDKIIGHEEVAPDGLFLITSNEVQNGALEGGRFCDKCGQEKRFAIQEDRFSSKSGKRIYVRVCKEHR